MAGLDALGVQARERVQLERRAVRIGGVVEERAVLGPAQLRAGIGHGLEQHAQVEARGDRVAGLVQQVEDAGLVAKRVFGALALGDVAIAPDPPHRPAGDRLRP